MHMLVNVDRSAGLGPIPHQKSMVLWVFGMPMKGLEQQ